MAADEILVISEGKIVERGKHADLVEKGGIYAELYETQFRRALQDYESRRNGDHAAYEEFKTEELKGHPFDGRPPADGMPMPEFPFPVGFAAIRRLSERGLLIPYRGRERRFNTASGFSSFLVQSA